MNTALTVADLRIQIGTLFSSDDFLPYLNQALQRLTNSGRWKGSQVYCSFASVPLGYVTLPYELLSIMGVNIGGAIPPVFGNMHEYIISGPGHIDETKAATGIFDYMNDGYPTRIDIPTSGSTLRIVLDNAADVGKAFRIYGEGATRNLWDSAGEGNTFTTTGLTTNFATVVESIKGIEGPVNSTTGFSTMTYGWTLYSVAPDTTATELSYYYPNESRPSYARYKTGVWNVDADERLAVRALCQRRFIPVYKETDWVIPGNTGALKAAMQAVQQEDAANYASSLLGRNGCMAVNAPAIGLNAD